MPYRGAKFANVFHHLPHWSESVTKAYVEEGAKVMTKRAKGATPVDTGELHSSWYTTKIFKTVALAYPAWEAHAATDVEYAPYVNYGTGLWGPKHAKYPIRPKNPEGWLHWVSPEGKDVFAKLVMHPGSPGKHMIEKAIMETMAEMEAFGEVVLEDHFELLRARWYKEAARARADIAKP